jgi:predicted PurR-regulated permease PerM
MLKTLYVWLAASALIALLFSPYIYCALIGLTLAVVAFPAFSALNRRLSPRLSAERARDAAAFVTEAGVVLVIVFGILFPILVFFSNREFLACKALALYRHAMEWGQGQMSAMGRRLDFPAWMRLDGPSSAGSGDAAAPVTLRDLFENPAPLLPIALRTLGSLADLIVRLVVLVLIMHACFLHGPGLWRHILEHAAPRWKNPLRRMGERAREVLMATYVIHGLTALSAFAIALPVFWAIVGMPYFFLAAVLAGLLEFLPFMGSGMLILGMALYYFFTGQPEKGWLSCLLAWPLVSGIPFFLVRPALARSRARTSPTTMLIGFLAGLEAFGVAGFVLGPLALELFVTFTKMMLYGPGLGPGNKRHSRPI